jgi:hypothetical protein
MIDPEAVRTNPVHRAYTRHRHVCAPSCGRRMVRRLAAKGGECQPPRRPKEGGRKTDAGRSRLGGHRATPSDRPRPRVRDVSHPGVSRLDHLARHLIDRGASRGAPGGKPAVAAWSGPGVRSQCDANAPGRGSDSLPPGIQSAPNADQVPPSFVTEALVLRFCPHELAPSCRLDRLAKLDSLRGTPCRSGLPEPRTSRVDRRI